jgi:hypothetical protein
VKRLVADGGGDTYIANSGNAQGDSHFTAVDVNDHYLWKLESNTGAPIYSGSGPVNGAAANDTHSVFIRVDSGDVEIIVDGSSIGTSSNTYSSFKALRYLNSSDNAGSDAAALAFSGFAVSFASGVADGTTGLGYSDFFDGSDQPIDAAFSGANVGGFAMDQTFDTVASWNAYAGTTGTVT